VHRSGACEHQPVLNGRFPVAVANNDRPSALTEGTCNPVPGASRSALCQVKESNLGPSGLQPDALPSELTRQVRAGRSIPANTVPARCGDRGIRTPSRLLAKELLYRWSYIPRWEGILFLGVTLYLAFPLWSRRESNTGPGFYLKGFYGRSLVYFSAQVVRDNSCYQSRT
jgi:hypothetical protein